jgi:hypothetical protein
MARSTQKELAALMREARELTGARTNVEAMTAVQAVAEAIKGQVSERSGAAVAVTFVSPYKNGAWSVSYVANAGPGACADISLYPPLKHIVDQPEAVSQMVLEDAAARGLVALDEQADSPPGPRM